MLTQAQASMNRLTTVGLPPSTRQQKEWPPFLPSLGRMVFTVADTVTTVEPHYLLRIPRLRFVAIGSV